MNWQRVAVGLVVLSLVVSGGIATAFGALNQSAAPTPNPEITGEVTKAEHQMGWNATQYQLNNGSLGTLHGDINESANNPFGYKLTDVNFSEADAFPRPSESDHVTEAQLWTKDMSGSAGSGTISNVTTAPGVDAVRFETTGQTSGDTGSFTFGEFTVTSDEKNRYLQFAMDVKSLDSGTVVNVSAVDSDGDTKTATLDQTMTSGEEFIGNSTGDNYVFQRQLGKMPTTGSGSGEWSNIEKVRIDVIDGNAALELSAVNLERMSPWTLGEKKVQTDTEDDDLETVTHYENKDGGEFAVHSLGTLGSTFENAVLHDLSMQVVMAADDLPENRVNATFTRDENNAYPGYYGTADIYYRMEATDGYDLSWGSPSLDDQQSVTEGRIVSVEYAEAIGSTAFEDISDSQWSDKTSLYTSKGSNVTVDGSVSAGDQSAVHYKLRLTEGEFNAMQSAGMVGGFGGQQGGLLGSLIGLPGAALASLLGILGLRKRKSGA